MVRYFFLLSVLFTFAGATHAQLNGTWVKYKSETENHVLYPQESWQLDTLIFSAKNFERKFLKLQKRYRFVPASIKGTYELTKRKIVFISTQNPKEVEESFNYEINQFDELVIGEWIYPMDENGERDYHRSRFQVWTYYRRLK